MVGGGGRGAHTCVRTHHPSQASFKRPFLVGAPCSLALIDFEQLRIENQSLAEKIEERTEELSRLKKKTNTMVQVG